MAPVADYGHDLLFGTFLTPSAADVEGLLALAGLTEQVGLDLVTLQDHPYQARFVDTWTMLSVIAARTTRVRISPNVANLPLRPPAVLARSVATLDLVSHGRVELGLGAGAFWDAIAAMGGRRLTAGQGVDALAEAIAVIRAVWAEGGPAVRVDGDYYRVHGAHPGPAPAHNVGIWVGAYKPRMLALTGRLADGWLPSSGYAGPDDLPAMNAAIDAAAQEVGRDPSDVRRLYNVNGRFAARDGGGFLDGPPEVWVEQLTGLALEKGISGFILASDDPDDIRRYAGEVAPAVRDAVELERSSPSASLVAPQDSAPDAVAGRETVVTNSATMAGVPAGLGVEPTPDDGTRRSDERPWDDATRPIGPPVDAERTYTPHERAVAQHLVDVHDGLRGELEQLRSLIEQVAAGTLDAGSARSHIATMALRQNNWTLGTYCESYCRIVTTHHTIEDQSMLPHLRAQDPRLAPVVDRLQEEHLVIHDLLDRVDRALVDLVAGKPDGLEDVSAAVDLLADGLLSHLSYEERELVEPLARLGFA
jgi:alkanesulfonate monooxygenase SsuD/methylene tetrahydromethanopterin reductase-like flavin-dependent oxidoreductase (luciferase family)